MIILSSCRCVCVNSQLYNFRLLKGSNFKSKLTIIVWNKHFQKERKKHGNSQRYFWQSSKNIFDYFGLFFSSTPFWPVPSLTLFVTNFLGLFCLIFFVVYINVLSYWIILLLFSFYPPLNFENQSSSFPRFETELQQIKNPKNIFFFIPPLGAFFNCNLRSSLLRCGTRPIEWGTQWDSNSLLQVC